MIISARDLEVWPIPLAKSVHFDHVERILNILVSTQATNARTPPTLAGFREYFATLARSTFVFSPAGAGLDCFRHWEAMALGAIPLVDDTPTTRDLLAGLPAVLLKT